MLESIGDIGLGTMKCKEDDPQHYSEFYSDIEIANATSSLFNNNQSLSSITLLNVEHIDEFIFGKCTNLKKLALAGIDLTGRYFHDLEINGITHETNIVDTKHLLTLEELSIIQNPNIAAADIGTTFANLTSLTSITFKCNLESLQPYALSGTAVEELDLPYTQLEEHCLRGMSSLNNISLFIDDGFSTDIGLSGYEQYASNVNRVFCKCEDHVQLGTFLDHCQASEIEFQDYGAKISALSPSSFESLLNVLEIDLEDSTIATLPSLAFNGCQMLEAVYLPSTLTSMQASCFNNCNSLTIEIPSSVISIENTGARKFKNFNDALIYIGNSAFQNAEFEQFNPEEENTIQLSSLGSLGASAFMNANNVTEVDLTSQLDEMPDYSFSNFETLIHFQLSSDQTSISVQSYAFSKDSNLYSFNIIGDDAYLAYVGPHAFDGCSALEEFIDFSRIEHISEYAFKGCASLTGDICLSSIDYIGDNAFNGCSSLHGVKFGRSMLDANAVVGEDMLYGCTAIETIDCSEMEYFELQEKFGDMLPDLDVTDVTSFKEAFSKLVQLFFGRTDVDEDLLFNFMHGISIGKNGGTAYEYECLKISEENVLLSVNASAADLNLFLKNEILPSKISSIADGAFDSLSSNASFKRLSFNQTAKIDCTQLFKDFQNIIGISMPNVEEVPDQTFMSCQSLAYANVDNADVIGLSAFYSCISLEEITLHDALSIYEHAFFNCQSLTSVEDIDNVECIQPYAFGDCSSLPSFSLPTSEEYTVLQQNVFNGCSSLTKLDIPANIAELQPSSLLNAGQSSMLSVNFIGRSSEDVLSADAELEIEPLLKLDNTIASYVGTKFFTGTNGYQYPQFITTSQNLIIQSPHPAFAVEREDDTSLDLVDIADNWLKDNTIDIPNVIQHITYGATSEIVDTIVIEDPSMVVDTSKIDDNVFCEENFPALGKIVLADVFFDESDPYTVNFWRDKTDSNENVTIVFKNGNYDKNGFVEDYQVFLTKKIDDIRTVYKILNSRVTEPDQLLFVGSRISSYVFRGNTYALPDQVITDLSIAPGTISAILDNAFSWNGTLTCIHDMGTVEVIADTAFEDCGICKITLPSTLVDNDISSGVKGYGLNRTMSLGQLIYDEGIVRIAPSAMIDCKSIMTSIVFPTTLESIGDHAFAEDNTEFPRIQNINFTEASSLAEIEPFAFYNSISTLANGKLKLPGSLTSIGDAAFAYSRETYTQQLSSMAQLDSSELEAGGIQYIGMSAFMFNRFKNVDVGPSVQVISDYAFAYPKYQHQIYIPSTIQHIGENAFYKNVIINPANTKANIVSIDISFDQISNVFGIEIDLDTWQSDNKPGFTNSTIVSALAGDGHSDFMIAYDGKLEICPAYLQIDILNAALESCDAAIESAVVPPYVTAILPSAFADCSSLTSINANEGLSIGDHAFYNCSSLEFFNSSDSKYHVSDVNDYEFYNCSELENIELLSSTTCIGNYAFYGCSALTSVQPSSIIDNLASWQISSIGEYAFYGCQSLQELYIPRSIQHVSKHMLDDCSSLSAVHVDLATDEFLSIAQASLDNLALDIKQAIAALFIDIKEDKKSCYVVFNDAIYTIDGFVRIDNEHVSIYEYDDNGVERRAVSSVNQSFFESGQTYLNLSAVNRVDQFTFNGIEQLHSISFLDNLEDNSSLEVIEDYAFSNCQLLGNINAGKLKCREVGCYAFQNCQLLMSLQFDYPQLQSIKRGAFYKTSLNNLILYNCPLESEMPLSQIADGFKQKIGYDDAGDRNPLELPEYCKITFIDKNGQLLGKFDFLMNNLTYSTIDTNRNQLVFINKTTESICPMLLVKQMDKRHIASLMDNSFHASIVGRWK